MTRTCIALAMVASTVCSFCRMRPPPEITSPGLEREKARQAASRATEFRLRCPDGEPRVGRDCGLLAYYWFSERHTVEYRRASCPSGFDSDCISAFYLEYIAAVAQRYEAVSPGVSDRVCAAQAARLECTHPLLFETLYLLAHNLTRKRFPDGVYDIVSAADAKAVKERETTIVGELTEFVVERLAATRPGLPDQSCPQRVFSDVECEGTSGLLSARWRPGKLVFGVE